MNQLIVDAKRKQRRASAGSKHDRMVSKQWFIDRHTPVYSSRIIRVYVEYLHTYYPEIDIKEVLQYAEMTRPELEDSAHWFSQHQVNRFHTIIAEKTTNKNIAREVGRYAVSSEAMGIFKNVALSLVNPAAAYMLLGKLYLLVSRAVIIETRRIGDTQVEIIISFKPGVQEKSYQCNNRLGTMEAIGKHFSNQFSKVDHNQCIHKGDSKCVYRVKWKKSRALTWLRLRNLTAGSSVLLSTILIFSIPISHWFYISLILGVATLSIQTYAQRLTVRDLGETVKTQGEIAEQHLKDLNFQYNSSLLIEEIGNATSTLMDMQTLLGTVANVMENRLPYDRGMLLLSDPDGNFLKYAAGYGFDQYESGLINHIRFRLNNPESEGLFTQTFHEQKPHIVNDIDELKHSFSPRSQQLVAQFNSRSLVCVPIIYEKKSLGILAVDNKITNRTLRQSDLNLLKGIASNIAISINNAISYNKLLESEEKYRDMFENVSDFLYSHDLEGKIIEANNTMRQASGYNKKELSDMNFEVLFPSKYNDQYLSYLQRIIASGHDEGVSTVLSKDGSKIIIEYKNSLIIENGKPIGVRGSARDITERWQSNKERKRLEGMLDRAKKMEALGTLAGGVAHDLNNILSGIVSYPELMLMDLPENSQLREPISIMMESGLKASAMVQDLLTLARRGVTSMEITNLNDIIVNYLDSPERDSILRYHPDVRFSISMDQNLLNIKGSTIHLFKTLMNLVVNAAEAMAEGGEISISSRNQYVDQAIKGFDEVHEGDYCVLSVSDTGIGISAKDKKHIFEPFYTKKVMGRSGTGLGMSVVWGTVKDHRGQIDIVSEIGVGTTIELYFPATREEKISESDAISIERFKGDGERVLVVDDVADQRQIAHLMLTRLGYRVETVPSGEEAVEYLKRYTADLIILDMIMEPGIDGLETFRRIRAVNSRQKAIIVSGYSDSEKVRQAQKIGVGAYVKKPYLLKDIGMAIRAELEN